MTDVIRWNKEASEITVGAAMDLYTLVAVELKQRGYTFPSMSVPNHGLSVGGVVSTAAHGMNYRPRSGHFVDSIVSVTFVNGRGRKIITTAGSANSKILAGVIGGVGLLGVITEVTFKVVPQIKTRLTTFSYADDADLIDNVIKLRANKAYDGVFLTWRPDSGAYTLHASETVPWDTPKVPVDAAVGPFNILTAGIPTSILELMSSTVAAWSKPGGVTAANALIELIGQQVVQGPWTAYVNNKGIATPIDDSKIPQVVGEAADMVVSMPCAENTADANGNTCLWSQIPTSDGVAYWGTEVAVPDTPENFASIVADIRKVMRQDLAPTLNATAGMKAVLPPGYIIMLWGSKANTILGTAGAGPVMYVETLGIANVRTKLNPFPARNMFVLDVIEQLLLCKYKGLPHFGKNSARTFTHPACPVKETMIQQLAELQKLQLQHDPLLLFQPELFAKLVAGSSNLVAAGCDPRRECFCTSNKHCAPKFQCASSTAFPEFKVCKPPANFDAQR